MTWIGLRVCEITCLSFQRKRREASRYEKQFLDQCCCTKAQVPAVCALSGPGRGPNQQQKGEYELVNTCLKVERDYISNSTNLDCQS